MLPFMSPNCRAERAALRSQVLELLRDDESWAALHDVAQELALERMSTLVEDQLDAESDARLQQQPSYPYLAWPRSA